MQLPFVISVYSDPIPALPGCTSPCHAPWLDVQYMAYVLGWRQLSSSPSIGLYDGRGICQHCPATYLRAYDTRATTLLTGVGSYQSASHGGKRNYVLTSQPSHAVHPVYMLITCFRSDLGPHTQTLLRLVASPSFLFPAPRSPG